MPNCFKCGEAITFNKKILSKTGKQIPLWADEQNTHGHDEQGNPIRGPLPAAAAMTAGAGQQQYQQQQPPLAGFPKPKPEYFQQETRTAGNVPTDKPSLESVLLNQINKKIDDKFSELQTFIEKLTVMDTPKFVGAMQQFNDAVLPFLKTNFKIASELDQDKEERDEKYRKEQEQIKKWEEAKDVNAEDNASLEAMDYENQRMETDL